MSTEDPELQRLRQLEAKACALRDRLRASSGLISDPIVLERAEDLCRAAREAIEAHFAGGDRQPGT